MRICNETIISKVIKEPTTHNFVFAGLEPNNPQNWIFSCSCKYDRGEELWYPRYDYNDPAWITESICSKLDNRICNHIKKCFIAKLIITQHKLGIEIPKWAKNYMGANYYKKSLEIIQDLAPIPYKILSNTYFNTYTRHGIGKVKIFDTNDYTVELKHPNIWTCTCIDYNYHGNCIHICREKILEQHLLNRRELCISLAFKYIESNVTNT